MRLKIPLEKHYIFYSEVLEDIRAEALLSLDGDITIEELFILFEGLLERSMFEGATAKLMEIKLLLSL